jgi:hypothetical protein
MIQATTVGYVDKSIFVQVDGAEVVVGMVTVPVTFNGPDSNGNVDTNTGPVQITIDHPDHNGCPENLPVATYIRTGDERTPAGDLLCCTECQPTSPAEDA